jgi:hypothetical protein
MTSWPSEQAAIENMIEHFGTGIFACVMDSYDYAKALSEVSEQSRSGANRSVSQGKVFQVQRLC